MTFKRILRSAGAHGGRRNGPLTADLYIRVYTNIAKDGWNITTSDKGAGIISASQSVSFGRGTVAPLTIVIETAGTGSKATATFRVGGGQTTNEDAVKQKLCSYFG
jgi:hypothetical protein